MTKNKSLFLIALSFLLAHCDDRLLAEESCAKVAVLIGEAWMPPNSAIKLGQVLPKGASLKTGPKSLVKLILLDDSILDLGPSSQIKLSDCQEKNWNLKINLELQKGSVRALVNKSPKKKREEFQLKTNTSVLAVRGTEFFVSWQQDNRGQVSEQIGVVEGQVDVRSIFDGSVKPLSITGGTEFRAEGVVQQVGGQIKIEPKAPPKVDQFTAQEQRQAEQMTKVEPKIFENAVDLSTNKNEPSAKSEKVASFINTTIESTSTLSAKRDVASDSKTGSDLSKVLGGLSGASLPGQGNNTTTSLVFIPARINWSISNR